GDALIEDDLPRAVGLLLPQREVVAVRRRARARALVGELERSGRPAQLARRGDLRLLGRPRQEDRRRLLGALLQPLARVARIGQEAHRVGREELEEGGADADLAAALGEGALGRDDRVERRGQVLGGERATGDGPGDNDDGEHGEGPHAPSLARTAAGSSCHGATTTRDARAPNGADTTSAMRASRGAAPPATASASPRTDSPRTRCS